MDAVLSATTTALIDGGYSALTMERVAAEAHASKATIYKSWPTKIDLVCAVAEHTRHLSIDVPAPDLDLEATLAALAERVRDVTLGRTGQLMLALHEASRAEPRIAAAVDEHLVIPQHAEIAAVLGALQQTSRIGEHVDTALAAQVIASLIIDRALVGAEPVSDEQLHRMISDWFAPALTPRTSSGRTPGPPAGPG